MCGSEIGGDRTTKEGATETGGACGRETWKRQKDKGEGERCRRTETGRACSRVKEREGNRQRGGAGERR